MRQSIYTSVSQAYEQAKIEEARDTPGLRVVAPALVPVSANPRGLPQAVTLGLLIGMLVAVCVGLWSDYLQETADRDPDQVKLFRKTLREAIRDLTHPWGLFTRLRRQ